MVQERNFNNLGTWLPDKIRGAGFNVQEFADKCKLSRSALYHFMKDTRRPDEKTIKVICRTLGVPVEEGRAQYTPRKLGRPRKPDERIQQSATVAE